MSESSDLYVILTQFCYVFAEILLDFSSIFSPVVAVAGLQSVLSCFRLFFAADLYSHDFGSVFLGLRRASFVVILAQCFCTYVEQLNNVL